MRKPLSVFFGLSILLNGSLFLTGCGDDSPGTDAGTEGCPELTGDGMSHGPFLEANETWTVADSPHLLPNGLNISDGVTLTLEACAVVRVAAGQDIAVDGKLVANGEDGKPVRFERSDSNAAWGGIKAVRVDAPISLTYTELDGGGDVGNGHLEQTGMLRVEASNTAGLAPMLHVDHVTIRGSATNGVKLQYNAAFTDESDALVIEGSAGYPIVTNGWSAGTIPAGEYTGNTNDVIKVLSSERMGLDDLPVESTWVDVGAPYEIGGETDSEPKVLVLGAPMRLSPVALNLTEGVELRFTPTSGIDVRGAQATLSAIGTLVSPVVFTSAQEIPMAGDWLGIYFDDKVAIGTAIVFAKILYAGNPNTGVSGFSCGTPKAPAAQMGNMMGAVYFSLEPDAGAPSSFVQSTEIRYSASNGFDRGWTGDPVDMTGTNTLSDIAFCTQTDPQPPSGTCMNPPMCPDSD